MNNNDMPACSSYRAAKSVTLLSCEGYNEARSVGQQSRVITAQDTVENEFGYWSTESLAQPLPGGTVQRKKDSTNLQRGRSTCWTSMLTRSD